MVSHFYFRSQCLINVLKFKENGLVKCFLSHGHAPAAGFCSDSSLGWMGQTHRVPAVVSSLPLWRLARVDGLLGLFLRSNKNKYETTAAALALNLLPLYSNRMWQCQRWSQSEAHSAPFWLRWFSSLRIKAAAFFEFFCNNKQKQLFQFSVRMSWWLKWHFNLGVLDSLNYLSASRRDAERVVALVAVPFSSSSSSCSVFCSLSLASAFLSLLSWYR